MLDLLLRRAGNLGRYTELRAHANLHTQLVMRKGVLIENMRFEKRGVSARCHRGGAFGFASRVGDSEAAIETVLAEAAENAELARCGGAQAGGLPEAGIGRGEFDYRTERTKGTAADRMAVVAEIDDYVTRTYPGLLNADIVLSNLAIEKALVTSEDAATYSYVPRSNVALRLAVQANDGVIDLHQIYGGFGDFEDQFESIDWIFEEVDRLYEELREKADGAILRGRYPRRDPRPGPRRHPRPRSHRAHLRGRSGARRLGGRATTSGDRWHRKISRWSTTPVAGRTATRASPSTWTTKERPAAT